MVVVVVEGEDGDEVQVGWDRKDLKSAQKPIHVWTDYMRVSTVLTVIDSFQFNPRLSSSDRIDDWYSILWYGYNMAAIESFQTKRQKKAQKHNKKNEIITWNNVDTFPFPTTTTSTSTTPRSSAQFVKSTTNTFGAQNPSLFFTNASSLSTDSNNVFPFSQSIHPPPNAQRSQSPVTGRYDTTI
jgi:hypothetical protein